MPLLAPMLVVPAGGDAAGAAANVVAGPGPSSAPQVPPVRDHLPVREHSSVREHSLVKDPTPVREPSPRPEPKPTPDSPSPPSLPPSSAEVGPTTSSIPPSPSRPPSGPADIRECGGDFASSLSSNEVPQTPAATAVGGAGDSAALTALTLKLDEYLHRVTTLENELGITKKILRVEQEFDLAALHTLASTTLGDDPSATMPGERTSTTRRHLRKPFTSSVSAHVSETIPLGVRVPAAATTIPAGSSVDADVHADAAPSSSIPTAADKGKAPMVDNSPPIDLLSEHEREELAHKAQAESVASPTAHGQGMSDQRHRELDAAQLIYTEADWLDLLAKIATNFALSKQLLGDDVTEENMNERLGMLLMRKRRELAEQSRVKPMTKTQQRDYMRDFVKNCSASVYNQGWTMKKVKTLNIDQLRLEFERSTFRPKPTLDAPPAKRANQEAPQAPAISTQDPAGVPAAPLIPADASLLVASSSDPAAIHVPAVSIAHAAVFVPADPMVHSAESHMDDPLTAPEHGSSEPTVAAPTPDSDSDDDPLPYAPRAGWEMVSSPLGSVHAYHNMAGYTKHFTTLHEILHMVERTDLQRLLCNVDTIYQSEELDTTAGAFAADDYIHGHKFMCTLERMLKHGLEVSKLLVRGFSCWFSTTLQMVFSSPWFTAKKELTHHEGTALSWLVQEQTALGKDKSNPLMAVMVCQKPLGYVVPTGLHVASKALVKALDGKEERRDEKKRLDHLKQDQIMLVIKRFSKRKKVFRERKKTGKIRAKRSKRHHIVPFGELNGVPVALVARFGVVSKSTDMIFVSHGDESIDSAFARFNTIITSLKALDEGCSNKNYVRKFLKALHPKCRAKVTAIEESKDLTSLSLD
nr:UBN2 domain-containing protein [Tanacetum cinerariifolium]